MENETNMTEEVKVLTQFEQYRKEFDHDLQIDRINLEEKQLELPAVKGKWVGRLMTHKSEKAKLYELYDLAIKKIGTNIKAESLVEISIVAAERQAEGHDLIKKIKKQIKEQDLLIEYLEKMEKHLSAITYDIRNITDIMKMEVC